MKLSSPVFADGGAIPREYTCDGEDISPPLEWGTPPAGTASLALIMDDPDAPTGTWVHWVVHDIPPDARGLAENIPRTDVLADGSRQGWSGGVDRFSQVGYGGPCPPSGPAHRYVFRLYALDHRPSLRNRGTKAALLKAMEGHVLAEARMTGRYGRS